MKFKTRKNVRTIFFVVNQIIVWKNVLTAIFLKMKFKTQNNLLIDICISTYAMLTPFKITNCSILISDTKLLLRLL
jgi:hypothetical protein